MCLHHQIYVWRQTCYIDVHIYYRWFIRVEILKVLGGISVAAMISKLCWWPGAARKKKTWKQEKQETRVKPSLQRMKYALISYVVIGSCKLSRERGDGGDAGRGRKTSSEHNNSSSAAHHGRNMDDCCVTVSKEKDKTEKRRKKKKRRNEPLLSRSPVWSSMAWNDESERKSDLQSRSRIERCLCVRHFAFILPLSRGRELLARRVLT